MPTHITCPKCRADFDVEDVLSKDIEGKFRQQYDEQRNKLQSQLDSDRKKLEEEKKRLEELKLRENEMFQERMVAEKKKLKEELDRAARKSIAAEYEEQMSMLQQNAKEQEEKLQSARKKEVEVMRLQQELKSKEEELELQVQKRLLEERNQLKEIVRKEEEERGQLKEREYKMQLADLENKLDQQRKLADEMKRKAEQGSMQLQGETQELLLEQYLKDHFPFDLITEVGKGVEGADCVQTVRNHIGNDCGKIIFESKRTKAFHNGWVDKLKNDMRQTGADVAILVTQAYPKDWSCFGEKDGIWICSFSEVVALTSALRHTILRIAETKKAEENKGEKMTMLYSYLTGVEFRQQIETIVEGFLSMKNSITKEKMHMEKIWKEREKQLERVLLSTSGLYGSIKGIAGASVGDIPLLDLQESEELSS